MDSCVLRKSSKVNTFLRTVLGQKIKTLVELINFMIKGISDIHAQLKLIDHYFSLSNSFQVNTSLPS